MEKRILKHFVFDCSNDPGVFGGSTYRGRLALLIEGDRLRIRQIAGCAAPAEIVFELIQEFDEVWAEALRLHREREHRYALSVRTGMSGCKDYSLIEERDVEFGDFPRHHLLHVSCAGKINNGVDLWLGDIPPLLAELPKYLPQFEGEILEAPTAEWDFITAGTEDFCAVTTD